MTAKWLAPLLAGLMACLPSAATWVPEEIGEGRRILFIGNSYLYYNAIPAMVVALADSAGGDKLGATSVVGPDMALIDHWFSGAVGQIRRGGWEWVVLQQGPSSVQMNRDSLRLVTGFFAPVIEEFGGKTVLFSAWPSAPRRQDFARAIESYRLAAQDVDGVLAPVAAGWLAAWEREPDLALYADGLHPSIEGAYLSALIVYSTLLAKTPRGLPAKLQLHNGFIVNLSAERATLLQEAAAAVTGFP